MKWKNEMKYGKTAALRLRYLLAQTLSRTLEILQSNRAATFLRTATNLGICFPGFREAEQCATSLWPYVTFLLLTLLPPQPLSLAHLIWVVSPILLMSLARELVGHWLNRVVGASFEFNSFVLGCYRVCSLMYQPVSSQLTSQTIRGLKKRREQR